MKRVLLVSYIFPPMIAGGVQRVAQTCKYLPEFGWAPTVLTVQTPPLANADEQLLAELPPAVTVERAYCPLLGSGAINQPHRQGGSAGWLRQLKRRAARLAFVPDWQVAWYPWAIAAGRKLLEAKRFDAVLATYGPGTNLLIGSRLAKLFKLPLIVDFRDMWADNPLSIFPTALHRQMCSRMEARIVRQAAHVIGVSEPMVAQLAARHRLPAENISCITNGFDPVDAERVYDDRPQTQPTKRPLKLCFAGSVYGSVNFDPLYEVISEMARLGQITPADLRLEFVGNMTIDEPRRAGIAEFVEIHPPVPHKQVFDFFARTDVLLLVEMLGYHAQYSFASKLFDYMLSGKPILALAEESEQTARVVRELGGTVVHPQDKPGIRRALESYLSAGRTPFTPVDIRQDPWREFNRRLLTERYAAVLDAVPQPLAAVSSVTS